MSISRRKAVPSAVPSAVSFALAQRLAEVGRALEAEITDAEWDQASDLMTRERQNGTWSTSSADFSYKEATAALASIANGRVPNATPGLVRALFEWDADVNLSRRRSTNLLKMFSGQNSEDVRSNTLASATKHCSDIIVYAMAQEADTTSINQALPTAIMTHATLKTFILLARGADASALCHQFLEIIDNGPRDLVEVLLQERLGACQNCRNLGLVRAAASNQLAKVNILLSKGADTTFNTEAALRAAVSSNFTAVSHAITAHATAAKRTNSLVIPKSQTQPFRSNTIPNTRMRTEPFQVDGLESKPSTVAPAHARPLHRDGSASLRSAMKSGDLEILKRVLNEGVTPADMGTVVPEVLKLQGPLDPCDILGLFVSHGLRGSFASDALLLAASKASFNQTGTSRLKIAQLLLQDGGADVNYKEGQALILAVKDANLNLFKDLLMFRPTVGSLCPAIKMIVDMPSRELKNEFLSQAIGDGKTSDRDKLLKFAMTTAAGGFQRDTVQHLVAMPVSPDILHDAFVSMTAKGKDWLTPMGLSTAQMLLDSGTTGPAVDDAFCRVASLHHQQAVVLLTTSVSADAFDKALSYVMSTSAEWQASENLWLMQHLLDYGCSGEPVCQALVQAITSYVHEAGSEALITTFLEGEKGADVNFNNGEALKIACSYGKTTLLKRLLARGAKPKAVKEAFSAAIAASLDDDTIISLIQTLVDHSSKVEHGSGLDVAKLLANGLPPLAACLRAHPESAKLANYLIQLGCNTETPFQARLHDFGNGVGEDANVLAWALSPHGLGHKVSVEVINALLTGKANVNYEAPRSKLTPLILATQSRRHDIVKRLAQARATPNTRDWLKRSALFYAARSGDLNCVKILVKAGSDIDDGSLHEAARNLHSDVVAALIDGRHHVDFPSLEGHEGRTVLQELAYLSDCFGKEVQLEKTLRAIQKGSPDCLRKHKGDRTALLLAFDNPHPSLVVKALCSVLFWKHVNDEKGDFIWQDNETGARWHYSPAMYLKKNISGLGTSFPADIIEILNMVGGKDRYYVEFGSGQTDAIQPEDAVGMPDRMAEDNRKRKAAKLKAERAKEEEHRSRSLAASQRAPMASTKEEEYRSSTLVASQHRTAGGIQSMTPRTMQAGDRRLERRY